MPDDTKNPRDSGRTPDGSTIFNAQEGYVPESPKTEGRGFQKGYVPEPLQTTLQKPPDPPLPPPEERRGYVPPPPPPPRQDPPPPPPKTEEGNPHG